MSITVGGNLFRSGRSRDGSKICDVFRPTAPILAILSNRTDLYFNWYVSQSVQSIEQESVAVKILPVVLISNTIVLLLLLYYIHYC